MILMTMLNIKTRYTRRSMKDFQFDGILDFYHNKDEKIVVSVQKKICEKLPCLKINPKFLNNLDKDMVLRMIDVVGKLGLKIESTYTVEKLNYATRVYLALK